MTAFNDKKLNSENNKKWRARGTKPRIPGNEYELYMNHEVSASQQFYYSATVPV